jgi:hypothetical protein
MLSGANAFEISNSRSPKRALSTWRSGVTMLHCIENGWMEFLRTTGDIPCKSCGSVNQKKFSAEMGIHFPELKSIDKPVVWVFPEIVVCLWHRGICCSWS